MTPYLLDTHILIWALDNDPRLPRRYRTLISETEELYVSIASLWEIAIKISIGKLDFPETYLRDFEMMGFRTLGIAPVHIDRVRILPLHHRDPFDRMLIAQSISEALPIMTVDRRFAAYEAEIA